MDRLHDRGMDVEEIADGLSHHLRQLLLLAVDPSLEKLVDAAPSDRERYAAQAKQFRPTDLNAMLGLLLETRGLLRRAEAPRILLEVALVELCTLPTAAKIEDLIRRLGELEAKLGGVPAAKKALGAGSVSPAAAPSSSAPERSSGSGTQAAGSAAPAAPPQASRRGPSTPRAEQDPSRAALGATALRLVESPGTADLEAADPSDPVVRWRQAVDRVKERKLLLGTCLEEGSFLGMAGGNVRLALSSEHAFHRAMLELKENREILNEELERFYGRGAKLLCESAIPSGREAQDAGRPVSKTAPAPGGGPEGTIVERIVELFDGEVLGPGPDEGNV
jgi:DNA polymerase-3 subunit gamma/tau